MVDKSGTAQVGFLWWGGRGGEGGETATNCGNWMMKFFFNEDVKNV